MSPVPRIGLKRTLSDVRSCVITSCTALCAARSRLMIHGAAAYAARRPDRTRLPRDVQDVGERADNFPTSIVEAALAHVVGSKVEQAYRRGDLFEKRRRLMDAWADFCSKPAVRQAAVVALRSA